MKTYVLYHANCWDGFCAAWIARSVLGKETECIPVQYGQEPPEEVFDRDTRLYVVDFSYPRSTMFKLAAMRHEPMIVLDHHKTARDALHELEIELVSHNCGDALTVTFDMNKSGGRLAWEHFYESRKYQTEKRTRPWLVDYTEDRDLWLWKLPFSKSINAYIRSFPLDFDAWDRFDAVDSFGDKWNEWVGQGDAILRREQQIIDDHLRHPREIEMDGHKIPVVNATVLFSDIAGELAKGRPFGACYFDRADGMRQWSLRSTDGGVDVAEIAKIHGGGGHRNAAGFQEVVKLDR